MLSLMLKSWTHVISEPSRGDLRKLAWSEIDLAFTEDLQLQNGPEPAPLRFLMYCDAKICQSFKVWWSWFERLTCYECRLKVFVSCKYECTFKALCMYNHKNCIWHHHMHELYCMWWNSLALSIKSNFNILWWSVFKIS